MIADDCRKDRLRLGDSASILSELIEWKNYQIHKAAKKKIGRQGKHVGNGVHSQSRTDRNANPT